MTRGFQPGESGNPGGRLPGSRNRVSRALDGLLPTAERRAIVQSLINKAKGGDTAAAGILLDRVWPKLRAAAEAVTVHLPHGDLVGKAEAIVAAIASGQQGPDVGVEILNALAAITRLKESIEFEARIAALEKQRKEN